jgi:hypothetical protein
MAILHQSIDGVTHHRRRPIPLIRQFGVGIGRQIWVWLERGSPRNVIVGLPGSESGV